jgi:transposase
MRTVADVVDVVVGVDTHADTLAAALTGPTGGVIAEHEFTSTTAGISDLIAWATDHSPGPRVLFAVEGTRSYGIGLARALTAAGLPVIEVERPVRSERRGRGKTDAIDAVLGARKALTLNADALPTARADGDREALRILLSARTAMSTEKTAKTNQLIALLRTGTDADRALTSTRLTPTTLTTIARRRARAGETRVDRVRRTHARRLATTITALEHDLRENKQALTAIVNDLAPGLLHHLGVGPVSAAQTIVTFSHPGRFHTEAAFAQTAGAAPLPASSGRTTRHRLNRGGDRQLNRALHDIAKTRMIHCPTTRAYADRRRAQGHSDREIRRCLKRYIARQLYRTLTTTMTKPLDNT